MRVRTLFSGISAGTELTAYRGTNPYLTSEWDPELRLFRGASGEGGLAYPLDGWGYSEVGEVVEVAAEETSLPVDAPRVGDRVWGIWGHRAESILTVDALRGHVLPPQLDPLAAAFVRVGAIALNGVLTADLGVGSTVVVFGQGVIGLLATRLATLNGATVIAVDGIPARREAAIRWGAAHAFAPGDDLALTIRELTAGAGADTAIELSGNHHALHAATRAVGADGTVVASGFYQGDGSPLRLGEEFHHNRVQLLASQIGSAPNRLRARWDVPRLQRTIVAALADGRLPAAELVTHRYRIEDAAEAYRMLDTDPAAALQVVLEF
ncbi:oxidoreductase [Leifsonia xyli subsp. cynodontis DSM 46306]|uniref:Alcohol dehydrogenase-like C-terminal domain-containing protein n=1 Tax=Leifsonia xyli subsp. cynodontis DSM 46306 TaxID=1389489 RepID=U3PBC8_LEIXC|nr:zinc-binding alcohol dehydrogenase [Leifsonia xyli]AGW42037.1 oxidoreductase [Leifsonia xyli subsp. cynodontis DSM 46306]